MNIYEKLANIQQELKAPKNQRNKFGGYNFEVANYLSPLSYDVFRLSTPEEGGDVSTSVVYQNPGWPVEAGGFAIK